MADDNIIPTFNVGGTLYFSPEDVKKAAFTKLARRIRARFPHLRYKGQVISFDEQKDKKIRVHSTRSRFEVIADPEIETEENLLKKLDEKEVKNMADFPVDPEGPEGPPPPPPHHGHGPHHPADGGDARRGGHALCRRALRRADAHGRRAQADRI